MLMGALPIVVHQISSFSKDMFHFAFGILALSLLLRIRFSPPQLKKEYWTFVITFSVSLFLFIFTRPQYIPFALLIPIALYKIPVKKNILLSTLAIVISVGGIVLLSSLGTYTSAEKLIEELPVQKYIFPDLQIQYLLSEPLRFGKILIDSLEKNGYFFYSKEMIGVLRANDTPLPLATYILYFVAVGAVTITLIPHIKKLHPVEFVLLGLTAAGTIAGVFLAMYLYGTPVASPIIGYVQGRYFTMLIPILIIGLAWLMGRFSVKIFPLIFAAIAMTIVITVYQRYYNYTNYFYREVPEVNTGSQAIIKNSFKEIITVDANRKLRGVSFYMNDAKKYPYIPYVISIYEPQCKVEIARSVVNMSALRAESYNDLPVSPYISGHTKVCVMITKMNPEHNDKVGIPARKIDGEETLFYPLYLY